MVFSRSTPLPLRIGLALAIIACVVLSFKSVYARLVLPFQIDYEEGNVLNAGLRILEGHTPYPVAGSFPYIFNPYGPIGYLVSAAGIKVFGLGLFGPRLLIFTAALTVVFLIATLIKSLGGRWDAGILLAVSYFCLPLVSFWMTLLRVDFLAISLSLLGLCLFANFPKAWWVAGVLFGLAILTKQTAVAAPAAVVLELLLRKKFVRGLALGAIISTVVLTCLLIWGANFVFAFFKTHPDPYSLGQAFRFGFIAAHGTMLILAVIGYAIFFALKWTPQSRLGWLYFLMCCFSSFTGGKLGSNMNHYLEWTAAVCIIGGIALSALLEKGETLAKPFAIALVALALVFAISLQRNFAIFENQKGCPEAYAFIRSFAGQKVVSEEVTSLVLSGKEVLVSNPFVVTQLGDSVNWQAGSLQDLTEKKYFDMIVLGGTIDSYIENKGGWPQGMLLAMESHYRPYEYFQCQHARVAYIPDPKKPQ